MQLCREEIKYNSSTTPAPSLPLSLTSTLNLDGDKVPLRCIDSFLKGNRVLLGAGSAPVTLSFQTLLEKTLHTAHV